MELGQYSDVLLVDMDIFSCGLTLWMGQLEDDTSDKPIATTYGLIDFERDAAHGQPKYNDYVEQHSLSRLQTEGSKNNVFILPCFDVGYEGMRGRRPKPLVREKATLSEKLHRAVTYSLPTLAEIYRCPIIVIDSHPGIVEYAYPACAISSAKLLISDAEPASVAANLVFAAFINQSIRNSDYLLPPRSPAPSGATQGWHMVLNRAPFPMSDRDMRAILGQGMKIAEKDGIARIVSEEDAGILRGITSVITAIPDLEELRTKDLGKKPLTSVARRGGNGFSLSAKYIVRHLKDVLQDHSPRVPYFATQEPYVEQAFADFLEVTFRDRGVGRSGISRAWLMLSVFNTALVGVMVFSPSLVVTHVVEVGLAVCFFVCWWGFYLEVRKARKAFEAHCAMRGLTHQKEWQKHASYNEGGSPATTASIWYPKACVALLSTAGMFVAVGYGNMMSYFGANVYSSLSSTTLGDAGSVASIAGLGLLGILAPFWKDVRFFFISALHASNLLKKGQYI